MDPNSVKVLVLNQTFEPLQVCSAKRAIILLFAGKAEQVEDSGNLLRSPSRAFILPSVIRLHRYVRKPTRAVIAFNKKNLLRRDAFTCQYCGRDGGERMTIDHVIPKSLGGKTIWENVVTSCQACNCKKGNKTLHEARMRLLRPPAKPLSTFFLSLLAHSRERPSDWGKYVPTDLELFRGDGRFQP